MFFRLRYCSMKKLLCRGRLTPITTLAGREEVRVSTGPSSTTGGSRGGWPRTSSTPSWRAASSSGTRRRRGLARASSSLWGQPQVSSTSRSADSPDSSCWEAAVLSLVTSCPWSLTTPGTHSACGEEDGSDSTSQLWRGCSDLTFPSFESIVRSLFWSLGLVPNTKNVSLGLVPDTNIAPWD